MLDSPNCLIHAVKERVVPIIQERKSVYIKIKLLRFRKVLWHFSESNFAFV